jgi:multiple sugar transport system permease protein
MMPALVTVLLFQFVGIWNNYFLPLIMLSNDKLFPITVRLTAYRFLAIPGALISTIPLLIGCVFLQRYWRNGLGTGSVKG